MRRWSGAGRFTVVLASLAGHAALLAALLHSDVGPRRSQERAAAPHAAQRALQVSWVRRLHRSAPPGDAPVVAPDKLRAAVVRSVPPPARRTSAKPAAAPVVAALVAVPTPTAPTVTREAVPDGSVFGLPKIGFTSAHSVGARTDGVDSTQAMQQALFVQQRLQATAAREAARAQMQAALQRELDAWPALDRSATCRLRAAGPECDDDALREPLTARAAALQPLLAALRQLDPLIDALTIEFRGGRYHGGAQVGAAQTGAAL